MIPRATPAGPSMVKRPSAYDLFDSPARNAWLDGLVLKIQRGLHPDDSPGPSRSPSPIEHRDATPPSAMLEGEPDADVDADDDAVFGALPNGNPGRGALDDIDAPSEEADDLSEEDEDFSGQSASDGHEGDEDGDEEDEAAPAMTTRQQYEGDEVYYVGDTDEDEEPERDVDGAEYPSEEDQMFYEDEEDEEEGEEEEEEEDEGEDEDEEDEEEDEPDEGAAGGLESRDEGGYAEDVSRLGEPDRNRNEIPAFIDPQLAQYVATDNATDEYVYFADDPAGIDRQYTEPTEQAPEQYPLFSSTDPTQSFFQAEVPQEVNDERTPSPAPTPFAESIYPPLPSHEQAISQPLPSAMFEPIYPALPPAPDDLLLDPSVSGPMQAELAFDDRLIDPHLLTQIAQEAADALAEPVSHPDPLEAALRVTDAILAQSNDDALEESDGIPSLTGAHELSQPSDSALIGEVLNDMPSEEPVVPDDIYTLDPATPFDTGGAGQIVVETDISGDEPREELDGTEGEDAGAQDGEEEGDQELLMAETVESPGDEDTAAYFETDPMRSDSQAPEIIELVDSSDDEEASTDEDNDQSDRSRQPSTGTDSSAPEEEAPPPGPSSPNSVAVSLPKQSDVEMDGIEEEAQQKPGETEPLDISGGVDTSMPSAPTADITAPFVADPDEAVSPSADALSAQILVDFADEITYDPASIVEDVAVQEVVETTDESEETPSPVHIDNPVERAKGPSGFEETPIEEVEESTSPIESRPDVDLETTDLPAPVTEEIALETSVAEIGDKLPDPYMPPPDTEQRIPLSPHAPPEGRSVSPSLVVEPPAQQEEISALPSAIPTRADTPTVLPDPYKAPADAFLTGPISPHDLQPSGSKSPSLVVEPPAHNPDPATVAVEPSLRSVDQTPSPLPNLADDQQLESAPPPWPEEAAASPVPEPTRLEEIRLDEAQSVSLEDDSKDDPSGQSPQTPAYADPPADEEDPVIDEPIIVLDEAASQDDGPEEKEESAVPSVGVEEEISAPDFETAPAVVTAPELESVSDVADNAPSPIEDRKRDASASLVDFSETIVARELQEEPLLRHHHGEDPIRDAPAETTRTIRHRRGRSSINTITHLPLTRSQCTYERLPLREGDLSAVVLAPQCVTADAEKLQEEGISTDGSPTREQESLAHSQRITVDDPRIHPSLLAQLHRLVGTKMVNDGHIYLLEAPVGSRAEDVEEETDIIRTPTAARRSMTPRRPRRSTVSTAEPEDRDVEIKIETKVEEVRGTSPAAEVSPSIPKGRRSQRLSASVEPASPMVTRLRTRQAEAASQQHEDAEAVSPQQSQTVLPAPLTRPSVSIAVPEGDETETPAPTEPGPSTRTRSQKRKHEREDSLVPAEAVEAAPSVDEGSIADPAEIVAADQPGSGKKKKRKLVTDRSFIPKSDEEDALGEDVQLSVTSSARKRKSRASATSGRDGPAGEESKDDMEEDADLPDESPSVRKTRSMSKKQPPPDGDAQAELADAEPMDVDVDVQVKVQEETKAPPAPSTKKRRWGWNPFGRK